MVASGGVAHEGDQRLEDAADPRGSPRAYHSNEVHSLETLVALDLPHTLVAGPDYEGCR